MLSRSNKGVLYIFISMVSNAFVPLLSKWSMKSFNPMEVAFLVSFFNMTYCLLWHLKWPIFEKPLAIRRYLKTSLINAAGLICLYLSFYYLDPITFAFLSVFYVVFTVLISSFVLQEGRTLPEIAAIGAGVAGAFFLSYKGRADWSSFLGVSLVLLETLCFAISNYLVKAASPPLNPVGVLFFNNTACTVLLALVILPGSARFFAMGFQAVHALGILAGSACSFAAVGLVFASYPLISFRLSGIIRALKPLISAGVALPFATVQLSLGNWLGALLLFVSIVVLVGKERRE